MKDGGIPKDVMKGELVTGHHPVDRQVSFPVLNLKDACKRELKHTTGCTRPQWMAPRRLRDREGIGTVPPKAGGQDTTKEAVTEMSGHQSTSTTACGKGCYPRIGLLGHLRRCPQQEQFWPTKVVPLSFEIDGCRLLILLSMTGNKMVISTYVCSVVTGRSGFTGSTARTLWKTINNFIPIYFRSILYNKHFHSKFT